MKHRLYQILVTTSLAAFLVALVIPARAARVEGNKSYSKDSPKREVASS